MMTVRAALKYADEGRAVEIGLDAARQLLESHDRLLAVCKRLVEAGTKLRLPPNVAHSVDLPIAEAAAAIHQAK